MRPALEQVERGRGCPTSLAPPQSVATPSQRWTPNKSVVGSRDILDGTMARTREKQFPGSRPFWCRRLFRPVASERGYRRDCLEFWANQSQGDCDRLTSGLKYVELRPLVMGWRESVKMARDANRSIDGLFYCASPRVSAITSAADSRCSVQTGPPATLAATSPDEERLFSGTEIGCSALPYSTGLNNKQEDRAMTSTSTSTQRPHRWIPTRAQRRCFQAAIQRLDWCSSLITCILSAGDHSAAGSRSAARQARKQKPVADAAQSLLDYLNYPIVSSNWQWKMNCCGRPPSTGI